ncbi:transcriptional regulator GcvA [Nitrogeniibacter mangrovi]|uniref:Transcriptional regulator GcvA n=1 Tax=Nitrogeniibacter mangrovi TaxID=2016596 RepID=A0A6C1B4Y8_9RHOO|nr:transcriptional regulator GcvA [Nitrogeniibacter mangrovi]QID17350.1 transcriptional regulator GcvA [Nitrogeniibacter mangrovi]
MALRLPPLAALRLFESAGRHQSFKLAAHELHLTSSAVSHGIASLEQWLGIALFERLGNGVALTREGREYLPFVSDALTSIAVGTGRLPRRHGEPRVSISTTPTFAIRWLLPRLTDFRMRYPDILVSVDTIHRNVDFPGDNVDLAIRMSQAPWPNLKSTCLFLEELVPVCSPAFKAEHQQGGELDLASVPLLHVTSIAEDWDSWAQWSGASGIDLDTGMNFDTVQMAVAAAQEGLGVAIGRRPLIDDDLAAGRLVEAAQPPIRSTTGFWLIQPADEAPRRELRLFTDWLLDVSPPDR